MGSVLSFNELIHNNASSLKIFKNGENPSQNNHLNSHNHLKRFNSNEIWYPPRLSLTAHHFRFLPAQSKLRFCQKSNLKTFRVHRFNLPPL
jgi:hypothetical protein